MWIATIHLPESSISFGKNSAIYRDLNLREVETLYVDAIIVCLLVLEPVTQTNAIDYRKVKSITSSINKHRNDSTHVLTTRVQGSSGGDRSHNLPPWTRRSLGNESHLKCYNLQTGDLVPRLPVIYYIALML